MTSEYTDRGSEHFRDDEETFLRLHQLFDKYFREDKDEIDIDGMEPDEALSYVYGMLLEIGEDPDLVLADFGIVEASDDN